MFGLFSRGSLRVRLVAMSVLSVTAVLAGMGVSQYLSERAQLVAALTESIDGAATRLSANLVEPLWSFAKDPARDVVRSEMGIGAVQAIVVTGEDGAVFVALVRQGDQLVVAADVASLPTGLYEKAFEVTRERKAIGHGRILFNADALRSQLKGQSIWTLLQILVVDACLTGILVFVLSRMVLRPLRVMGEEASRLREAVAHGRLGVRADAARVPAEFRPVLLGMNETLDAYAGPIAATTGCLARLARGLPVSAIAERYEGDFNEVSESVGALVEMTARRERDIDALIAAATEGRLSYRADPAGYQGSNARVIEGMNRMLDALVSPLQVTASCLDRIARGDIPEKIVQTYRGDFEGFRNSLNTCIDAIRALVADADALAQSGVQGQLATRADASRHQGDFRKIIVGVNATLDAVTRPMSTAARCVEQISRGEIPGRIDEPWAGDFAQLRDNLNTCIEAVNRLVRDADRLVEAAVAGELSLRADASLHRGDFRKIILGVNATLDALTAPVGEATAVLQRLAGRDLRARLSGEFRGDHARLKDAINATASALHQAMEQVAVVVEQVSSAATQIASSSQAVASGASEQAASLGETTSTVESLSGMTQQSAQNAQQARGLATAARAAATEGAAAVEQLQATVEEIRRSAEGTGQIIRDVSDIAFQTNLLALNAAVEAARAGDAGRGFAVVAEEVRSLALRAKEAAGKTEELIRRSVQQAGEGDGAARQVATRLAEIVQGISKVSDVVSEIADSARAQETGIARVATAMTEMDRVTQQNAASAEESSSAASELSGQAEELAQLVNTFSLEQHAHAGHAARRIHGATAPNHEETPSCTLP